MRGGNGSPPPGDNLGGGVDLKILSRLYKSRCLRKPTGTGGRNA